MEPLLACLARIATCFVICEDLFRRISLLKPDTFSGTLLYRMLASQTFQAEIHPSGSEDPEFHKSESLEFCPCGRKPHEPLDFKAGNYSDDNLMPFFLLTRVNPVGLRTTLLFQPLTIQDNLLSLTW
ncbi:MAG: hypothetical protein K8R53_10450 [Bacteroidales bacterium]|nr:hypothetical protein [Bacteroidales bacterium]